MSEKEIRIKNTIRSLKLSLKADPTDESLKAKLSKAESTLANLSEDSEEKPTQKEVEKKEPEKDSKKETPKDSKKSEEKKTE